MDISTEGEYIHEGDRYNVLATGKMKIGYSLIDCVICQSISTLQVIVYELKEFNTCFIKRKPVEAN